MALQPVRMLILGTGGMANNHAEAFAKIEGVQLVAGIDTRPEQLKTFCDKHKIGRGFASITDALAWGHLAQLFERSGQRLRSVRAGAEARAALGDVLGAIERLRAVQRLARTATGSDVIEASVVEARLRDLEAQRKQIVAEERGES